MLTRCQQHESRSIARAGFTLVEMLVAVALVLLMMTMFAEIFQLATGSMSKQKGLAELDQRQRLASTLIRDDLRMRSFRNVFAFHPSDNPNYQVSANRRSNVSFDERKGYLYISENDPENDGEDVLQLTVDRDSVNASQRDGATYFGRTKELLDTSGAGAAANPNQPENDDGAFYGEGLGVGTSRQAEVSYFLRNGILYRRVLLIRQLPDPTYLDTPSAGSLGTGVSLFQNGVYPQGSGMAGTIYVSGATLSNRYPQDFDYSATNDLVGPRPVMFAGSSLTNNLASPLALGQTYNRFGFQRPTGIAGLPIGKPLEYLPTGDFVGRFTHEETSHSAFAWPGDPGWGADSTIATADDTNPYTRTAGLAMSPNGVVTLYAGGPRQGEDILLTNVQSFDVKVWDPGANVGPDGAYGVVGIDDDGANGVDDVAELGWPGSDDGAFVDIGHTGVGFFSQSANAVGVGNLNSAYGPLGAGNRCFDTWHPDLGATLGLAPFRPATVGKDLQPGNELIDDDGDGTVDNNTELGWPNTDDVPVSIKAIQIRIRYLDISSGLVRELTIVEQLTPDVL